MRAMTTAAKPPREAKVPFSRSIQAKYALTYLLVVAAILIVMNTYPLLMVENMVFASKESTLKQQALVIGSALAVSETLTQEGVEQTMAVLEKAQGTRVLVADGTGRILYDSSTLDNRLGDYALMGEVVAALRGRDVARSEYREGAIRCRAAVPVLYHGATLGAVSWFWVMRREDLMDEVGRGAKRAPGTLWYCAGRYLYVPCAILLCGVALLMQVAF